MWHLRLVSYQNKYILLVISNLKTFPKRLGLFCKIQKHKAFPIILCSRILWSRYFFFDHVISFSTSIRLSRLLKKSIFYFWQMYYTLGCLDKKYLELKISTWTLPWMNLIFIQTLKNKSESDNGGSKKHSFWSFMLFSYGIPFPLGIPMEERHFHGLIL